MEVDDQRTQQLGYYKFQTNGITREFEENESGEKMKTPNFINGGFNNPSSRIIRVSRATGGKDRHSKVWTSKGLRDRRVRLSVPTAIQFYDLQDRLGFDQPSKAVEWLIKAAADSISDLPSLKNTPFPDSEKLMASNNENIVVDGASMSKSACSSNSDPDPGSDLSRSEIRDKARERAKVRRKEKEKEKELGFTKNQTFTELLTGSVNANQQYPARETGSVHQNPTRNWTGSTTGPLDYFSSELETVSMQMPHHHHHDDDDHHHHQEMAFIPDHLIATAVPGGSGSYNHDFNIMCLNRGTLQSNNNSPQTFFSSLQRFSSDGGSGGAPPPFFMAAPPPESFHHHQFQFYYDNGYKNSDSKGKSKN